MKLIDWLLKDLPPALAPWLTLLALAAGLRYVLGGLNPLRAITWLVSLYSKDERRALRATKILTSLWGSGGSDEHADGDREAE
jgi:hypothetical protein